MLGGFVPPSSGRLLADGKPIVAPGIDRGIVFQEYALFPWLTVFDNIAYGLEMAGVLCFADRADRLRAALSARAVRRHEATRRSGAHLCLRTIDPSARRTVRRARFIDARDHAGRIAQALAHHRQDIVMMTHDVGEAVYLSNRP